MNTEDLIKDKYDRNEPTYVDLMEELKDLFDDEEEGQGGEGEGGGEGENKTGGPGGEGEGEDEGQDNSDGDVECLSDVAPTEELSDRQKKQLAKAIEAQKEFLEGNTKKTKMSKKDKQQMNGIETSDASIESVNGGYGGTMDVAVIRKISKSNRGICDMYSSYAGGNYNRWGIGDDDIVNGFRLGTMLGKKLRVRNDDIKTTYNRQKRGGIDRRLLAELGVGNTKIFEKSFISSTNDAGIHISIDASGSMGGDRIKNAIVTSVAIAKACDMVGGIRVRIDLRSDCSAPGLTTGTYGGPVVMVAYDSKTQNMLHIKQNFPYLRTGGGTPEGICFEAIKDIITQGGNETDKYFINMSDGAPTSIAVPITTKAVKNFKAIGLKVMSYFISSGTASEHTKNMFDNMYGKDSTEYVDTTNIVQIAKTLNKLLSERA